MSSENRGAGNGGSTYCICKSETDTNYLFTIDFLSKGVRFSKSFLMLCLSTHRTTTKNCITLTFDMKCVVRKLFYCVSQQPYDVV